MNEATGYATDPGDGLPARVVRQWTRRKHYYLARYADIFSVGMKNRFPRRAYLDLFSGPGRCLERETQAYYDGSPMIAFRHNFTDHIYVELRQDLAAALDARCAPWKRDRYVSVIQGDCNDEAVIDAVVAALPKYGLTFAFVDPTNWQVTFETMRRLTAERKVDLLVSFFAGSMKRVADLQQPRLDAFFGTDAWQKGTQYRGNDGEVSLSGLLGCYRERLQTIGFAPRVAAREIEVKNSKNVTMYLLAFFSKNPKGFEFWDKITTEDERGQLALRW